MYLISKENGKVGIECDNCGKVNMYPKKYFSYVSDTACINKTLIQCPNCSKQTPLNSKIFSKENPEDFINPINNNSTPRRSKVESTDVIKCPRCSSTQLATGNKGFGVGKAAAGAVLFGPIGLIGGAIGSNKTMITCLNCGKKWEAGKI